MAIHGKLPTNVKAIVNASNGLRIEGADLTKHMLEYALNNRDQFNFIYQGDVFQAEPEEEVITLGDQNPTFSEADLSRMNKGALLEHCERLGILVEGEPTNAELVEMILTHQESV